MPRTKGGPKTRRRRKRILKLSKGYWGARRKLYAVARETLDRALAYAFAGRKQKKRQYRRLWIARINAGLGSEAMSYSHFMCGLRRAHIDLDRRALADLAAHEPHAFAHVVKLVRAAAGQPAT